MASESSLDGSDLVVHVYTLCWNEELILPFFLRHYSPLAQRIVIYDNMSTDSTRQIVENWPGAELRSFDTNEKLDTVKQTSIKNTAYKESRGVADFVIVVDVDEFLYHEDFDGLLREYKHQGVTLPQTRGFDMVSWRFPSLDNTLPNQIFMGREREHYAKRAIFNPSIDINFSIGAHHCAPIGGAFESRTAEIRLLHFHYIGLIRCIRRHRAVRSRLGSWHAERAERSAQYKWGSRKVVVQFIRTRIRSHNVLAERSSLITTLAAPLFGLRDTASRRIRSQARR